MYEQKSGARYKLERGAQEVSSAATTEEDRRGYDRQLVIASAEVVELSSGARFSTRTTDLGPGGCFVETLTPFPVGSKVRVTVYKADSHFESLGVVVYSQQGMGMGVAFEQLDPKQSGALDQWFSELIHGRVAIPASKQPSLKQSGSTTDHAALLRLVQLMISKGIITEAEGSSVIHDPVL